MRLSLEMLGDAAVASMATIWRGEKERSARKRDEVGGERGRVRLVTGRRAHSISARVCCQDPPARAALLRFNARVYLFRPSHATTPATSTSSRARPTGIYYCRMGLDDRHRPGTNLLRVGVRVCRGRPWAASSPPCSYPSPPARRPPARRGTWQCWWAGCAPDVSPGLIAIVASGPGVLLRRCQPALHAPVHRVATATSHGYAAKHGALHLSRPPRLAA